MPHTPTADATHPVRYPNVALLPGIVVSVDAIASAPSLPPLPRLWRRSARSAAQFRLIVGTL